MNALYRAVLKGAAVAYVRSLRRECIRSMHTVEAGRRGFYVRSAFSIARVTGITLTFPDWPSGVYIAADIAIMDDATYAVTLTQTYQRAVDVEVTLWLKGEV